MRNRPVTWRTCVVDSREEIEMLKIVFALGVVFVLSGCGTLGGAVGGAGEDLQKVGEWIKDRNS